MTGSASAGFALLESKLDIPEQPRFVVARPRLLAAMPARPDRPVTLVVGPPGSGKTQLVASWVRERAPDAAVAWITLEREDGQPGVFWSYVTAALRRAGVPLPAHTAPVDRSFLLRLAARLAERRTPVLLVLDGVSAVEHEGWATQLEFVLRHAGPVLRLVLLGRWNPPLLLHRYRLAGQLTEIRGDDLAFTAEEAAELLALHRVELSPAGLTTLLERTEGWAAGIRLFAMALQNQPDADRLVGSITGNEATIAAYLVDEVLRAQPPHVRAFLLDSSVLETFTPELAEAVTGRADARRLLAELTRRNTFVQPVTDYSAAYRFHRLFAQLLRAQLTAADPQRVTELHRRAASWLAARGRTVEAVGHAVEARDWRLAATTVVEHHAVGRVVLEGRHGRLGALLERLPDDPDDAEVSVVSAALALADAAPDRCARQLADAQELVIRRNWDYSPALALADSVLGVLLAAARGDHGQVLALSPATEHALDQAPAGVHVLHPELRALTVAARGIAHSHAGAVDAATSCLTQVAAATAPACRRLTIDARQHLALIEVHLGNLRHAERLATEAVDAADRYAPEPRPAVTLARVVLARVAQERTDVDAAERHLRAAQAHHHGPMDGVTAVALALVKARRLQDRGEPHSAVGVLEEAFAATAPTLPGWLARETSIARGHLLISIGRPGKALEVVGRFARPHPPDVVVLHAEALAAVGEPARAVETLTPLLRSARLAPSVGVQVWLARAKAAEQLGDAGEARDAVQHALRAATPQGQRRAVHQVWARLHRIVGDDLVERYRTLQGVGPADHRRVDRTPDTDDLVIVEALSRREMEVLQGMAGMMPTEEIAARLYVSVNTVKTHVRSILRKLSASRRNEAVRRARSLGLIGDLTHPG